MRANADAHLDLFQAAAPDAGAAILVTESNDRICRVSSPWRGPIGRSARGGEPTFAEAKVNGEVALKAALAVRSQQTTLRQKACHERLVGGLRAHNYRRRASA